MEANYHELTVRHMFVFLQQKNSFENEHFPYYPFPF